jgi:hypothetical protein
MKNKLVVVSTFAIVGIGFMVYLGTSVVPKSLTTVIKAGENEKVSVNASYLIGEKITAVSNGKDKIKVNVFVVDNKGIGIKGKTVTVSGINGIEPELGVSDNNGQVHFEASSVTEGQYELTASINGVTIPKTVKVTFRN